ncbi:hypothetical protein [Phascolarctobacterium sp.]|uniref:hypothetical protein n=1 Tax=Phascolarctobacterium sp. TaxID=2049039 RepID=UPI0038655F79
MALLYKYAKDVMKEGRLHKVENDWEWFVGKIKEMGDFPNPHLSYSLRSQLSNCMGFDYKAWNRIHDISIPLLFEECREIAYTNNSCPHPNVDRFLEVYSVFFWVDTLNILLDFLKQNTFDYWCEYHWIEAHEKTCIKRRKRVARYQARKAALLQQKAAVNK